MPVKPMCRADGRAINEIIRRRGYTKAGFARKIGRPQAVDTMRNICLAKSPPISVEYIRQIARGLYVRPGDISDWKHDDEHWEHPVRPVPADPEPQAPAA